ncbi:MAG TPA: PilZ domain-containing protein [Phycisphaerae bacterium]|nr:PilZ domain-containing protein [Phycisphaerae bacterium]HOJ76230.1 PilZ domain-containing protein [Phycisphaerae bacterium]HOM53558.1 PilZ domain-containing protein [Phycisphaerae bacterium]HON68715.1 PilZ domain-containing protein [Phycisphaerae bacterium]HPP28854.1 PilZ domain-containing protein [Phycisphaerae bacterium]
MSTSFLHDGQSYESLSEAIRNRYPATLTYQAADGWTMIKTRFLPAADHEDDAVCLEVLGPEPAAELPEIGRELGVSFRRGSRKCVFTAGLLGCSRLPSKGGRTRIVMRLSWPDIVQELQRRLYHRTPVPPGHYIPVDLWLTEAHEAANQDMSHQRGRMLDLSAGGLSVELPREVRPRWREDDRLACRFAGPADRQPIEVTARITYYERRSDGQVRMGLQFLGLDAGDRGRRVLQQINQITQRLRRAGFDRH